MRIEISCPVGAYPRRAAAHTFEPKPLDAKTILQSRLFVISGLSFEPWAQKLAKSAGYKGYPHAGTDPHAWQDPSNVML